MAKPQGLLRVVPYIYLKMGNLWPILFRWYDRVERQKALGYRLLQTSNVMTQALFIGKPNCIVWQDWVGLNRLPFITPGKRLFFFFFFWMKI